MAPLVNNTFVIQDGQNLTKTLYGGTDASPSALIRPPFPNDSRSYYWMGDGTVEGDKLHAFVHRYPLTPGTVPPSAEATDVATFSLPELNLEVINEGVSPTGPRPWAFAAPPVGSVAPVTWGAGILEDGEFVYVYGTEEYPLHKFLHVARFPAGQLLNGPWEYYTGTGWSKDPLLSTRILKDVSGELSVVKTTGGYRVVASLLGLGDIMAYEGPNPFGPWGEGTVVYSPSEASSSGAFTYNSKEHPQLSCDGTSVISYNVNGTVDGKDSFQDIHVYRPRFIEVSGLTPVHCANVPPIATDDRAEIKMNSSARIPVLDNDNDPDGDSLSVVRVTQGANGMVRINSDNTITYQPRRGFKGIDSFSYVIDDGNGGQDTGLVTVNVRPSLQAL